MRNLSNIVKSIVSQMEFKPRQFDIEHRLLNIREYNQYISANMIYYFVNNYIPQNQEEIKEAMGYRLILITEVELSGHQKLNEPKDQKRPHPKAHTIKGSFLPQLLHMANLVHSLLLQDLLLTSLASIFSHFLSFQLFLCPFQWQWIWLFTKWNDLT